jgi:response regulator RpfG family c-di-GMP phosphodiesterase
VLIQIFRYGESASPPTSGHLVFLHKIGSKRVPSLDQIRMLQKSGFELYDKIKEIDEKVNICFITAFEEYYDEFKKRFSLSEKTDWFIRKRNNHSVSFYLLS